MIVAKRYRYSVQIVAFIVVMGSMSSTYTMQQSSLTEQDSSIATDTIQRVHKIIISGNVHVPESAILKFIPYRTGEFFDQRKTGELIRSIYFGLKRFRNVRVLSESAGHNLINIHVELEEKPMAKDIIFTGNTHIPEKDLRKALDTAEISAIDTPELKALAQKIKKEYTEKGYHLAAVETKLDIDEHNKAVATFIITEGKKSVVRQVRFKGNNFISSKELRAIMVTREEWLLSFLDKAGLYQPERVEADKYFISRYYQNRGFLHAKVTDVTLDMNEKTKAIRLTYYIEEGNRYTIDKVSIPGNELLSEEQLLARVPVRPGQYYSPDRIADTLKVLERIWGNYGHIFSHIDPSIEPDEETKKVNLTFYCELGNKMTLNKINIRGNKKTRAGRKRGANVMPGKSPSTSRRLVLRL